MTDTHPSRGAEVAAVAAAPPCAATGSFVRGRTAVVTGATSGVGWGTARGLAALGARLVLPVRDLERGEQIRAELARDAPGASVELLECDLASQRSVRHAAQVLLRRQPRIHVIVNIAGVRPRRRRTSSDGVELTWATSFLGPFLLTHLLLERLERSAPARILTISGSVHRHARLQLDDPELRSGWSPRRAAAQAALAKAMWTYELARCLERTEVTANSFCPGPVRSRLGRELPWPLSPRGVFAMALGQGPEQGARLPVRLASDPGLGSVRGEWFRKGGPARSSAASHDRQQAAQLVALAERMTGLG